MFSRMLPAIACWMLFGVTTAFGAELDESSPRRLAVSPDGKSFALVSEDKRIRIWDAGTKSTIASRELDLPGTAVAFSPDGKMLVVGTIGTRKDASQPTRGYLYGWSFEERLLKRQWRTPIVGQVMATAFEPNGKWFAANTVYATLATYRAEDGKLLRNWQELGNSPSDLAISPDGKTIVTAGQALILWDSTREKSPEEIGDPEKPLSAELCKRFMKAKSAGSVATTVAADGNWAIAVGSFVNAKGKPTDVVQVDMRTAKIITILAKDIEGIKCVTLSPDEKTLALGFNEGAILLIDSDTKRQSKLTLNEKDRIRSIAYMDGGKKMLVASEGGRKLSMIAAESGRLIRRIFEIK